MSSASVTAAVSRVLARTASWPLTGEKFRRLRLEILDREPVEHAVHPLAVVLVRPSLAPLEHETRAFGVLHRAGVTVEMIRYPDEPHGLKTNGRPDRRADRIDRIVSWFRTYL